MSKEFKVYPNVGPLPFTVDGTAQGTITVASTLGLYQWAEVVVSAFSLPDKQLQIKRIVSHTQIVVGPRDNSPSWSSVSFYTVALSATVTLPTQSYDVSLLSDGNIASAVYESHPIAAIRTLNVDPFGDPWSSTNPLPVSFDGSINISDVRITAADNDPVLGRIHSSVRINNGATDLGINTDGSINVNLVSSTPSNQKVLLNYNEVSSVGTNILTTLITYTVPVSKTAILQRISVGGENVATYQVLINNVAVETKRTWWGAGMNELFMYDTGSERGYALATGDIVKVTVIHTRPMMGNFESTMQVIEIT